ncbi:MAG TPA: transcription/translation regulatory transformer protein RfaH [Chromatiales bacterium]|nr:transcription/translation regulatory transformer protein RfaH [Chromatiales bacterium]
MTGKRSWYLIHTKPRQERLARDNLQRQGYEIYLPLTARNRRRNGRYHKTIEALFPRYLFIRLDCETDNWAPIRSTLGVSGMVRFGGLPAVVPEGMVAMLRGQDDESGIQRIPIAAFKPGDKVTIIEGPLSGCQGIYQQERSADRVAVLLDIVSKHTTVMLSRHDLQLAENE